MELWMGSHFTFYSLFMDIHNSIMDILISAYLKISLNVFSMDIQNSLEFRISMIQI